MLTPQHMLSNLSYTNFSIPPWINRKIKIQTFIHCISRSVISAWRLLTEQSNLRAERLVMCARGGSGEYSFAPVSLLICSCAAWPSLGKFSSKSQPEHRPAAWEKSISSPRFQAEIAEKSTALIHSHHIIPHTHFSEIVHGGLCGWKLSCPVPSLCW